MIRTDCIYYKGESPCSFHKKYGIECNEKCPYYKKIKKRILIIKKDALGDVLRTTPILHAIKAKYGQSTHITWLISPYAYDLIKYNHLIDRAYKFNFESMICLQAEKFDVLFSLDKDKASLALSKLINAEEKYGFTLNEYGNLTIFNQKGEYALRLGLSDNFKKKNEKSYPEFICELGELPYSRKFKYIFNVPNLADLKKDFIEKFNLNKKTSIIGFNPGSKFKTRIWPKKYWVDLGIKLIKEINATILLFGAKLEIELNNFIYKSIQSELSNNLKGNIINTGSNNNLFELSALISLTDILVSADTLGSHIAIALEVPSIVLYGPTPSQEIDLFETGQKIIANSSCLICYKEECDNSVHCLSLIKISDVFQKIIEILNN